MNLLIVEDDEYKLNKLVEFFSEEFPEWKLTVTSSYQSGIKEIKNNEFDFIILDMSMHNFDRSASNSNINRFKHYAGRDILIEMKRKKIKTKTIVVTQFEVFGEGKDQINSTKLNMKLLEDFSEMYLGMVYFNASLSNWKNEIKNYILQSNGETI